MISKRLIERSNIDAYIISEINKDSEVFYYLEAEEIEDPDLDFVKKEFKNIIDEIKELKLPLITFYDIYSDTNPYTDIMDYIRFLHESAKEDFNLVIESNFNYLLNYDYQNIIMEASLEDFLLLEVETKEDLLITIVGYKTIFNTIEYIMTIEDLNKYKRYYDHYNYLTGKEEVFKILDAINTGKEEVEKDKILSKEFLKTIVEGIF